MSEFTPPTTEQLQAYLDHHPPRLPSPWAARLPLIVLGAMVVVLLLLDGLAAMVLPWAALGGLMAYLHVRMRQTRRLEAAAMRTQELAMRRRHAEALRAAWRMLPAASTHPTLYMRCAALIGHCLDQLKAYEAALACYDRLLDHMPGDHPGTMQVQTRRVLAALAVDRLIDADDTLRWLRGRIAPYARTPIGAGYRLAQLAQSVCTHHYADALDDADGMLDDLRPLGVEAGYGHALLALCYRQAPVEDDDAAQRAAYAQASALWWKRATTLLPAAALVDRFPAVRPLTEASP